MLARNADNLFWVARYIERADFSARMDSTQRCASPPCRSLWRRRHRVDQSARRRRQSRDLQADLRDADQDNVIAFSGLRPSNTSSIRNCIANARTARAPCARP